MTKPKETKTTNPIEEAIGERANPTKEPIPLANSHPSEVPDEPNPTEMLALEELNRQTEERYQQHDFDEEIPNEPVTNKEHLQNQTELLETAKKTTPQETVTAPALKPDLPPETKTCTPESPPQTEVDKIDEYQDAEKHEPPTDAKLVIVDPISAYKTRANPAEELELKALRDYIMDSGFVVSGVAMHIVSLCSHPMVTPATTSWDFKDRAYIPEMVFTLLRQPGYIEGIWPSLKVVMGDNRGNASWSAGIATTIAFFDIIRTLPAVREMENETEKKS